MNSSFSLYALMFSFISSIAICDAQQITGAWKGKINNQRVELKIIQKGDSLTGTSYYHGLTGNHKRYSIKGYFDPYSNSVVWWDDELITPGGGNAVSNSLLSIADFNCPGGGRMFLDGKSSRKESPDDATGKVSLTKIDHPTFQDEWDYVLDNYTEGTNDPYIIDSISRIATSKKTAPAKPMVIPTIIQPPVVNAPPVVKTKPNIVNAPPAANATPKAAPEKKVDVSKPVTIDELFTMRKKVFTKEIPVEGDSIQLQFYDNAEVDGDSITLYLNNKMIFTNVRLSARPFVVILPVHELASTNELVMVAENLGAIPPNTAFMIAIVGDKRYEAYLESTEGSSSLIRFTKNK